MGTKTKKGFTLVEMLIVIVIIGILAAALLPRIMGAQARTRDVARKSHLNQINTALLSYQIDNGSFPTTSGDVKTALASLVGNQIQQLFTDPLASTTFTGVGPSATSCISSAGEYRYTSIKNRGITAGAFVLMARTEEQGVNSNRVNDAGTTTSTGGCIDSSRDFNNLVSSVCSKVSYTTTNSLANCTAKRDDGLIRYIFIGGGS